MSSTSLKKQNKGSIPYKDQYLIYMTNYTLNPQG